MIRLDKMLSELGVCTRSEAKKLARAGRILVNGVPEKSADRKIDELQDEVLLDDQAVSYEPFVYYLLNKPAGVVSASSSEDYRTVIDLIPEQRRGLFPVGRLDKDTEGLLLITNDGALAHALLAPGRHVDKEYEVQYEHPLSPADIAVLQKGMKMQSHLDGGNAVLDHLAPVALGDGPALLDQDLPVGQLDVDVGFFLTVLVLADLAQHALAVEEVLFVVVEVVQDVGLGHADSSATGGNLVRVVDFITDEHAFFDHQQEVGTHDLRLAIRCTRPRRP